MSRYLKIIVLLTVLLIPFAQTDWLMDCSVCKCKWNSGKKTADCKNVATTQVPRGLSMELQVLDLSNNFLPEIEANEFAIANLGNLHKLFIRNATLRQLHRDSLKGLAILIELDLSHNSLKQLPRSVFNNLTKIRALMLNNNQLDRLDDGLFRNLKFLHKIELKENHLKHIEMKAFTNLPVLAQILLDGNRLTVLYRECFQHLDKLTELSMKQNPWNCTCDLRLFREFAITRNLYTPPTDCYYPEPIRGMLWTSVSDDTFACQPKILYPSSDDTTISSYKENTTILCRIEATPNTAITWTYNRHALQPFPKRFFIRNLIQSANNQNANDVITSELTIAGARQIDEGVYTCRAENVGGRAEIDIQLLIGRDSDGMLFITNRMLLVFCLMAVGLLMVSFVIMIVTCCYCRKFRQLIKRDLDDGGTTTGISIGADGTLNTANGKKPFQTIKLDSFGNATMIGNGNCIVSSASTAAIGDACHTNGRNVIANKIAGHQIGNDCEFATSNERHHASNKADTINDVHRNDKKSDTSEIRHHQIVSTAHSAIVSSSPTRHLYTTPTTTTEQTIERPLHRSADSRLPPDLLPYGQHHQTILHTPGTLKNSSSSSTGSSSSTVLFDHRSGSSCNGSSNSRIAFAVSDNSSDLHSIDGNDVNTDTQIYLRSTIIEEPDLRIYHNDTFINVGKMYGKKVGAMSSSSSPSPTTSSRSFGSHKFPMTTATVTATAAPPITTTLPHRTKITYELTPSAQILNNANYSTLHTHRNVVNAAGAGGGGVMCKARQSVIRTSPSFSFLSAGYNQQQGNFL